MRHLSFVAIIFLVLPACTKNANTGKCDAVICTPQFAKVQVQVTNSGSKKAALDEVYTVNARTGERLNLNQDMGPGYYLILDDGYRAKMVDSTIDFRLVGKKNGVVVVDEPYTISADCCHISKESGKEMIVVR